MIVPPNRNTSDLDDLLLNAELRNQLEPLRDESLETVCLGNFPTAEENAYLASMLAWERAPILPIRDWFSPSLELPAPHQLSDSQLSRVLARTIKSLYTQRIVLDFTEHLDDRHLYCLIYRDILPCPEKKIDSSRHFLHWDCANVGDDPEIWLRYYATEEERAAWAEETGRWLPMAEEPPHQRDLPRAPL